MASYTVGTANVPTNTTQPALVGVLPGSTDAVALLEFYAQHTNSAGVNRYEIYRSTGGTPSSSPASERVNSASLVDDSTTTISWSADPTKSGLSLIVLGYSVTLDIVANRRWMPPNPRYPLRLPKSGNQVVASAGPSSGVSYARYFTYAEPSQNVYRTVRTTRIRGTRIRSGVYDSSDGGRHFNGLGTAPKCFTGSSSYRFVQPALWPDSTKTNPAQWLALFSGGAQTFLQSVDGAMTSSGDLIKLTARAVAGGLATTGNALKMAGKVVAGSLTGSGVVTTLKFASKALAGALSASGAMLLRTGKVTAGALTATGAILKAFSRPTLAGALAPAGALLKRLGKLLAGALTASGVVAGIKIALKAISGSLTASGAITRQVTRGLSGALAAAGALARQPAKALSGALAASGAIVRQARRALAGALTASGAVIGAKVALKALAGALTASGAVLRKPLKALAGALTPAGAISRRVGKALAGAVSSAGALARRSTHALAGALAPVGTLIGTILSAVVQAVGPAMFGRSDTAGLTGRADPGAGITGEQGTGSIKGKVG